MNRKATIADFDFVYSMYMHPTINPHLLYEQMSAESFRSIFEKLILENILYVFEENRLPLGMFKFVPHTYRSAHVGYIGSFAIQPHLTGKGLGLKMMTSIIAMAKESGFKRLELSAGVQNEKAISLYRKAGFGEEGILKKYTYFKNEDRFIDEVMMSYIIE
jgi:L-phenylalanine/L-methionine N-acetyltransferase